MFDTWRQNFGSFFLVYLVLGLVSGGVSAGLSFALFGVVATGGVSEVPAINAVGTSNAGLYALYILVLLVATVVVETIVVGGMTEYSVRRARNEMMTLRQAIDRGVERFVTIFGATLIVVLLVVGIFLVPVLLLIAGALSGAGPSLLGIALLGLVVAFVMVVYLALGLFLFAPAIMLENTTALNGLRRSWQLTKGHRLSLFGAIIVAGIITLIVNAIITIPARLTGSPVVSSIATAVAGGIVGSWVVILSAVTYNAILGPQNPGTTPIPTPWIRS